MLRFAFESLAAMGLVAVALTAWRSRGFGTLRARQFSVTAAAGAALLAVDESLNLHERLGSEMYERGWHEPAGINHFDDLLLMVIAVCGLAVAAWFAGEIVSDRRFAEVFAAAVVAFAGAIAWDAIADPTRTVSWWVEESLEFAGVAAMLVAFARRKRALEERELDRAAKSGRAAAVAEGRA